MGWKPMLRKHMGWKPMLRKPMPRLKDNANRDTFSAKRRGRGGRGPHDFSLSPEAGTWNLKPEPILKPKAVFRDTSVAYKRKRRRGYGSMARSCAAYLLGFPRTPAEVKKSFPALKPFEKHSVAPEFFGMNLCPSHDPAGDEIQIEALRDLGVRAVRMDYGTRADRDPADRLLEKLLDGGFKVTLHIVQDPAEASVMDREDARRLWRAFLTGTLRRFGERLEALEIGSTPNRHSWSGYSPDDYALAAAAAREVLDQWNERRPDAPRPLLLGPNISDFAPYFNVGQMALCRRLEARFDVATDNLFFDRVGEPEAYDPHVLGKTLRGLARMDLARKQRFLAGIARRFGVGRSWCTYAHYTLDFGEKRTRYVSEEQYANYLVRSMLLTAAAGAFERFYWGTLVTHYKGLIDETVRVRPYPPFVHHRFAVDGAPSLWKRRKFLFRTYSTMTGTFQGLPFTRKWETPEGVVVLEFEGPEGPVAAGWTRDGQSYTLRFSETEIGGPPRELLDREGWPMDVPPEIELSEAPLYWKY